VVGDLEATLEEVTAILGISVETVGLTHAEISGIVCKYKCNHINPL